jgi:hypothetical protein
VKAQMDFMRGKKKKQGLADFYEVEHHGNASRLASGINLQLE